MADVIGSLRQETDAAKILLLNIRDVIGDDEQAAVDAIEGETNLLEAIEHAVSRIADLETMETALDLKQKALGERKSRFAAQAERIRTAILSAMTQADLKKHECPLATVSRRAVAPSVIITEETEVPAAYWKPQDPKLDKKAILAALKSDEVVPGATLSNGGETLSVRFA